jgi:hypothetical protein
MRRKTTRRYVRTILCYLTFILRIELGGIQLGNAQPLALELPHSNAAAALIQALKSSDNSKSAEALVNTAIHRLLMATLHQARFGTLRCPFTLFLVFINTKLSGVTRNPDDISGSVSELKWPLRAAGFHEIVVKLKEVKVGADAADWQSEVDSEEVIVEGDSPILK